MSELPHSFEYLIDGEWRFQTGFYSVCDKGRICGRNSLYCFSGIKHGLNYLNFFSFIFFSTMGRKNDRKKWKKDFDKHLGGNKGMALKPWFRCYYAVQKRTNRKAPCKRTQHCWPTTPNIVGCNMLRPFSHSVACCWRLLRKVWIFEPRTPNISVVPRSPKRCAAMLDPSNNTNVSNVLWVVSFPQWTTGPNIIGSCYIRLHTTANADVTTPNICWRNINIGSCLKPHANWRKIVDQQLPTLVDVTCCVR